MLSFQEESQTKCKCCLILGVSIYATAMAFEKEIFNKN